ncbi:MAG: lipoyl(octanoyl) transferase LipB [Dongiaceae bacterium]
MVGGLAVVAVVAAGAVEWRAAAAPVPYPEAVQVMERRVAAIRAGTAPELIWLLEHPPLYTAGTSAKPGDLLRADRFPVHASGRGGQYTYHGPGQRVAYVMLDLQRRGPDLRRFVHGLEKWLIGTLAQFGIAGERRQGRVGIWVARPGGREDKIAAIGVRVRRWVSYHGVSINLNPDLEHFSGIVPCGVESGANSKYGVTSLHDLGVIATMGELDSAITKSFAETFCDICG